MSLSLPIQHVACSQNFVFPEDAEKNSASECKIDKIHGICSRCLVCVQCNKKEAFITNKYPNARIYHSVSTELPRDDCEISVHTPLTGSKPSTKCCRRFHQFTPFQKKCSVIVIVATITVIAITIIAANS